MSFQKKFLSFRLSKMFNTGLRDRQIKYWSSRKPQCQLDTLSTRSISIYETAPALILLAFGMLVASVTCIIENIIHYRFTRCVFSELSQNIKGPFINFART